MIKQLCTIVLSALFVWGNALAVDIGVAWVGKAGMPLRVMNGFTKGIKEKAPEVDFTVDIQKELSSMQELEKVVAGFEKEKDGMVILRSNGAQWLAERKTSIPTFIGACNNPSQLGTVKNLSRPGGNITGVTYYIPASTHLEVFKAMQPQMKSVFLLMEQGHPGSLIDQNETQVACSKLGLTYDGKMCSSLEDVISTVKEKRDNVSAFIIGSEALVIDNTAKIIEAAGKTPVFAYSEKPIMSGAIAGYVADDEKLGYMLAESVIEVLVKGKDIGYISVKTDPQPTLYINGTTYQKIGLIIPPKILGVAKIIQ